eukprot:12426247-Karenia_brevis.AAC.1
MTSGQLPQNAGDMGQTFSGSPGSVIAEHQALIPASGADGIMVHQAVMPQSTQWSPDTARIVDELAYVTNELNEFEAEVNQRILFERSI